MIEEIKTSFYVFNTNKDYKIIIRMPTVEYLISSLNFLFIKYLSSNELIEYFDSSY